MAVSRHERAFDPSRTCSSPKGAALWERLGEGGAVIDAAAPVGPVCPFERERVQRRRRHDRPRRPLPASPTALRAWERSRSATGRTRTDG